MIATLIVAHPKRIEWAEGLAAKVGGTIVLDTDGLGAGGNHREALRVGLASGAEWLCVLEDDALPVEGVMTHVAAAVERRPAQMLGLYVGRQRPRAERVEAAVRKADEQGAAWLTYPGLLWGVATVWPARLAGEFLADQARGTNLWDVQVKAWCQRRGLEVAYCWPSLVEHRDDGTVIAGRLARRPGRIAHRVGIPQWSDLAVAI